MSLLEQDITREGRVDENVTEFETGNNEKYDVEGIWDSVVYTKELATGHLPGLYYLISWKGYHKKENTWEPALAVQHLQKMLNAFHKDNPDKPIATFPQSDTAPLMARPLVVPLTKTTKWKRSQTAATSTWNKKAKRI